MIEDTPLARYVCETVGVPIEKMDTRTYTRLLEQAVLEAARVEQSDDDYVDDVVSGLIADTASAVEGRRANPEQIGGKTQVRREMS
jgi:hypothetical protein